jgi:DNA-binding transcriptional MerR regulator
MVNYSVNNQCEIAIGRLSKIADVNVDTVCDYQLLNLTEESMAPKSGYSKHSYKIADRIKFINHAQKLGFNLNEIRKLLVYWNK